MSKEPIIITGASGFIGFHIASYLLDAGYKVVGVDNLNNYYDVNLKLSRLNLLNNRQNFIFHRLDITNTAEIIALAEKYNNTHTVIHLAAQAGVRYSLLNPYAYTESNVSGSLVVLELCKHLPHLKQLIYASSSSVYGNSATLPFSIDEKLAAPVSLYAATKISGEAMCYSYSHLYNIPITVLRFFTVYGPWGRPDMAAYLFTKAINAGEPIKLFNNGNMKRDFTYIDDIIYGLAACINTPFTSSLQPKYRIYNLGNNKSEHLIDFLRHIEQALGKKAIIDYQPMQQGDMTETYADITDAKRDLGFNPSTSIAIGIPKFVDWFKTYHN